MGSLLATSLSGSALCQQSERARWSAGRNRTILMPSVAWQLRGCFFEMTSPQRPRRVSGSLAAPVLTAHIRNAHAAREHSLAGPRGNGRQQERCQIAETRREATKILGNARFLWERSSASAMRVSRIPDSDRLDLDIGEIPERIECVVSAHTPAEDLPAPPGGPAGGNIHDETVEDPILIFSGTEQDRE